MNRVVPLARVSVTEVDCARTNISTTRSSVLTVIRAVCSNIGIVLEFTVTFAPLCTILCNYKHGSAKRSGSSPGNISVSQTFLHEKKNEPTGTMANLRVFCANPFHLHLNHQIRLYRFNNSALAR